ncbi:DUF5664 domain-containing protein [Mycobacteroides chelonae]|nr:DUF5664 domain-containing protein [Mycobacteroides chelonae]
MSDEVRVTSSTGGEKGSKLARFDLVPVGPQTELAELYGRGALKYESRNWERGYDWGLSYAALCRHLTQFWAGEDRDAETGAKHIVAVAWHAFALAEFMETHPEFDNRPGKPVADSLGVDLETRKDLVERAKNAYACGGVIPGGAGGAGSAGWPYGVTFYGSAGGSVG